MTLPLRLLPLTFFIILSGLLHAEELTQDYINSNKDLIIKEILYSGNTKTKPIIIDRLTGIKKGKRLSEISIEEVKTSLISSNLFSEAHIFCNIQEDSAVITITVVERWTLLPIPIIGYGSNSWKAGLGLYEMNFAGMRQGLFIGGAVSNLGGNGFFKFSDPYFLGTSITSSISISGGNFKTIMTDMKGDTFASFLENSIDVSLSFRKTFLGKYTPYFEYHTWFSRMYNTDDYEYSPEESSSVIGPGIGLIYQDLKIINNFNTGVAINGGVQTFFALSPRENYYALKLRGNWAPAAVTFGHLELGANGEYGNRPLEYLTSLGGKGFRTLPQDTSFSSKYFSGYLEYDVPFLNFSWGFFTLNGFFEYGGYETGVNNKLEYFYGPGTGFNFNLAKVALSAVGINLGYNMKTGYFVFSTTLGYSY